MQDKKNDKRVKHGWYTNASRSRPHYGRIESIWKNMHQRCYRITNRDYHYYGAKGIEICDEWHDLNAFYAWCMDTGYSPALQLDRINSDGDYTPDNCRWITKTEQMNNVSNNRIVTVGNEDYTVAQLARKYGLNYHTVYYRLEQGWPVSGLTSQPGEWKPDDQTLH